MLNSNSKSKYYKTQSNTTKSQIQSKSKILNPKFGSICSIGIYLVVFVLLRQFVGTNCLALENPSVFPKLVYIWISMLGGA